MYDYFCTRNVIQYFSEVDNFFIFMYLKHNTLYLI